MSNSKLSREYGLSPADWEVTRAGNGLRLLAKNAPGAHTIPMVKVNDIRKIAEALSPKQIEEALALGDMGNSQCRCNGGLNVPRCQHKFTYTDVQEIRGAWHAALDPVRMMANHLKEFPANQTHKHEPGDRDHHVTYYVKQQKVCRGFFRNAWELARPLWIKFRLKFGASHVRKGFRQKILDMTTNLKDRAVFQ
jgi:hypothetical protein